MQVKENVTDMQHHEQQLIQTGTRWPWLLLIITIGGLIAFSTLPMRTLYSRPTMRSKQFRLLAFGDSLTAGYHAMGTAFHPYSHKLKQLAAEHHLQDFKVDTMGISGEVVLPDMVDRLSNELAKAKAQGIQYTHVLIFGGTNDIGGQADPQPVFEKGLRPMYEMSLDHGAHVVAMTMLGLSFYGAYDQRFKQDAQDLSAMIRQYVQNHHQERMSLVDLEALVVGQPMTIWDDKLHLTPQGYDIMGQHIWDQVFKQQVAGTHRLGLHPYTIRLQQLAEQHNVAMKASNKGVPGEVVLPEMMNRLSRTLNEAQAAGQTYTHVLILGGTNDLGRGRTAAEVFEGLSSMYQDALAHGAHVVPMTLPGCRHAGPDIADLVEQIQQLNTLIRQYGLAKEQDGRVTLVDVEALMVPRRDDEHPAYWDDMIHLTPAGYDLLGQHVWERVFQTPFSAVA